MLISKFLFLIRARVEGVDLYADIGEGLKVELSVGEG